LLLSRFLLEAKICGRSRAKTRANPACGRTHRQLIQGVLWFAGGKKIFELFFL
jgi:hypothetical protein